MPTTSAAQPQPTQPKRGVSIWIKIFVVIHLIAITSWSLPNATSDLLTGKRKLTVDWGQWRNPVANLGQPAVALSDLGQDGRNLLGGARDIGRNISDGSLMYNDLYVKQCPIKYYTLSTGFWQYWDMFSPNPASIDFYGTATVFYQNGSSVLYHYPRMYDLSIPKKYVSERYRKFYERAHTEEDSYIWPVFAQRIALINYSDPNNPPVRVVLTRHWLPIAPPGKPQQQDYNSYNYYTYTVDLDRLKQDKAGGIFG